MQIKALQIVLSMLGTPLVPDGIMGSATLKAVQTAKLEFGSSVDVLLELVGFKYPLWYSNAELEDAIQSSGFSKKVQDYIRFCVEIETFAFEDSVANDMIGKHQGIGQFNASTWASIMGTPFSESGSLTESVKAIGLLYLDNFKVHNRSYEKQFSNEVAYLYHNQGASSSDVFLRTGKLVYPKQSADALEVFKRV